MWSRARFRLALLVFVAFLGLVIYTADIGKGPRYWGWLARVPLGDKFCHAGFMLTLTALSNLTAPDVAGTRAASKCADPPGDRHRFDPGPRRKSCSQIWIPRSGLRKLLEPVRGSDRDRLRRPDQRDGCQHRPRGTPGPEAPPRE